MKIRTLVTTDNDDSKSSVRVDTVSIDNISDQQVDINFISEVTKSTTFALTAYLSFDDVRDIDAFIELLQDARTRIKTREPTTKYSKD